MSSVNPSSSVVYNPLSLRAEGSEFTGDPAKPGQRVGFEGSPKLAEALAVVVIERFGKAKGTQRKLGNAVAIAEALAPMAEALASRTNRVQMKIWTNEVRALGPDATVEDLILDLGMLTASRAKAYLSHVKGEIGQRDPRLRAELVFLVPACQDPAEVWGVPVDISILRSVNAIQGLEGPATRVPPALRVTPGWRVVQRAGQGRFKDVAVIATDGSVHDAGTPEAEAVITAAAEWATRRQAAEAKRAKVRKAADRKAKATKAKAKARKAEAAAQADLPPSARQQAGARKARRRKATSEESVVAPLWGAKELKALARELGVS